MIQLRCGVLCEKCVAQGHMDCKGCINSDKTFRVENCLIRSCYSSQPYRNCDGCKTFPYDMLHIAREDISLVEVI